MSEKNFQEAAYQVNDASLLYLREMEQGCRFTAFDMASEQKIDERIIPWEEAADMEKTQPCRFPGKGIGKPRH